MKVLVVDDAPAVRRRLAARVREAGGEPIEIADAEAAIEATRVYAPDVVILDLHFGAGLSGLAALPRIKSVRSSTVVIVLTSQPSEPVRRECLARGADHFLDKSSEFERVAEIVQELARARALA